MKKFIFLAAVFLFSTLSAQQANDISNTKIPLFDVLNKKYKQSLESFYQERAVIRTVVPQVLEDTLEQNNYHVGPGDEFKVVVIGDIEDQFNLQITPEGTLLLPSIGEISLNGLTLREAKIKIRSTLQKFYLKSRVLVNLVGLRKFRVYLVGEVFSHGTYFVQGSDRLSDIIEVAAIFDEKGNKIGPSLTDWADDTQIQIFHRNGKVDTCDITRFYQLGDRSQNPYLQGGDVIYVPSINLKAGKVFIEGNVGYQGVYSLKKGETIFSFLRRVNAINKRSDLKNIIIERAGKRQVLNLLDEYQKYLNFRLMDGDLIIVPTINGSVYVKGEVSTPGSLPYLANYKAKDYIGLAGALNTGTSENEIIVVRHDTGQIIKGPNTIVHRGDFVILPKRRREVFKDYATIFLPIISIIISTFAIIRR